jgi:hypothetical protein
MSGRVRGSDELRKRLDKEALPFDWALFEAAQHAPVGLAKHVMRAVIDSSAAGQAGGDAAEEAARLSEEAVRLAFKCHQLAGGFDAESNALFADLVGLQDSCA